MVRTIGNILVGVFEKKQNLKITTFYNETFNKD